MTFVFNAAIPAANNNPSVDQPDMLGNNIATDGILAVDHISFNLSNGGNHLQVHLPQYTTPAVVNGSATQGSVVYGAAGVADAAHAQLHFKTAQNAGTLDFQISAMRAWATCDGTGAILASQSSNIASIVSGGLGRYNVTLNANAVTSDKFAVLVSSWMTGINLGQLMGYNITGIGTFQLVFLRLDATNFTTPTQFSFQVMQI